MKVFLGTLTTLLLSTTFIATAATTTPASYLKAPFTKAQAALGAKT